jgi:prepilin-type N-terminal cleavage/methylation domain-containing protein
VILIILKYRSSAKFASDNGISIVELLVVIVIIAILATLAFMNRGNANEIFQRQNAVGELKVAFERARFDSVKRRGDGAEPFPFASVEVRTDGYTLRTYTREGSAVTATPHDTVRTFPAGISLAHYSSGTLPMTITFNRRGETAGGVPQFRITDQRSGGSQIVLVTPTGTVNVLPGTSSIPTFANPTLSGNPAATDSISNQVVVP